MTDDPPSAMVRRAGSNPSLVPAGSPLVARALSDLVPAMRRVLIVAGDGANDTQVCDAVRAVGCMPAVAEKWARASDLVAWLPFDVAILTEKSLEFVEDARASLPHDVPIVYRMPGSLADAESGSHYRSAVKAGAAFVLLSGMMGRRQSPLVVLSDALVLARFLRDHPQACGWPAPPPPDPDAYRFLVVDFDGYGVHYSFLIEGFGYRTTHVVNRANGREQLEEDPPDVLWACQSRQHADFLVSVRERIEGRVPSLVTSCASAGCCTSYWPEHVGAAFRWMDRSEFGHREWRSACNEAVRLRRAFQYALSRGRPGGASSPDVPPPLPPS